MSVVNVLPEWLPVVNLIISVVVIALLVTMLIRAYRQKRGVRVEITIWAGIFMAVVLVSGSAFQANMINLEVWSLLGTGGRIAAIVVLLTLLTTSAETNGDRSRG